MGKNIVVFSDGTGQEGGTDHNTNVYKTFNLILDRSRRQVSFYDKGLGTGWKKATGNIMGRGFSKKILEGYKFIFENFEDDDRIFLFGFSRGAATVRSLSGFIHLFGVLPRSRSDLIEKAWKIYKIKNREKRKKRATEFVDLNHTMWARVHFLGVWDTVAALGLPDTRIDKILNWIVPHGFHDFELSDSVTNAYHALAIDDCRKTFHPVPFTQDLESYQTLRQVWFMGMHTDVGGGYTQHEVSDIALEWMVQNAVREGLHIFKPKDGFKTTCTPNANGHMHDSRDTFWKRKIFKAKQRYWDEAVCGRAVIHQSVEMRTASTDNVEDGGYEPWILGLDPEVERWTHLPGWKTDPSFVEATKRDLDALEGWCLPTGPSVSDRAREASG